MKFCPVCRYCYENHDTLCVRGDGAPLKDWPQRTEPGQEGWVSGSCKLTERYSLVRLISSGGMGTIFEAVDKNLDDRPVAIKILHRHAHLTDPDALARFRREARSASRVNHSNVAVVHDYGVTHEWGAFIVMELIDGENLAKRLKAAGRLPIYLACQIAQQVAYGIGALHRSGFVHRDLKPSNVIITLYDEDEGLIQIKVVDFGIVKAITPLAGDEATPTNPGLFVGTPYYTSPEHCANKPLDARSDIYSLGVLLFETLAGRKPFTCNEGEEVTLLSKHLKDQPPLLREFRPEAPEGLERLIDSALRKDPAERPQSAYNFARALRPFIHPDSAPLQNAWSVEPVDTPGGEPPATELETETGVRPPPDASIAGAEMQRLADSIEGALLGGQAVDNSAEAAQAEASRVLAPTLKAPPADALPTDKSMNGGAVGAQAYGKAVEGANVQAHGEAAGDGAERGGSVIRGTVVLTSGEGVVVDFGFAERLVTWDKFATDNREKVIAPSAGQRVEALVTGTDSPDGFTFLSRLRTLPQPEGPTEAVRGNTHPNGHDAPKEPPAGQPVAGPEVSDNRVVLPAVLPAVGIVLLMAAGAFVIVRLWADPARPDVQAEVPTQPTPTGPPVCATGGECVVVEDSHLRAAPGKLNEQGEENESVGIATKGSLVEVLETDSVRKNWRRVRVVKHGRKKKLMWEEEGWMDGNNLRPASNQ